MAQHNDLGKQGEEIAINYLTKNGYKIIKTNWRFGKLEIDIIARINDILVFVEVKTRSADYWVEPEYTLTKKQQGFLIKAANAFIDMNYYDMEARFDVFSIVMHPKGHEIKHIDDAFYPYSN